MFENIPPDVKIVLEPIVPSGWIQPIGKEQQAQFGGDRWVKFPVGKSQVDPDTGNLVPRGTVLVSVEDFQKVLDPSLVTRFQTGGFCLVVVGSTQRGRAIAEPEQVPKALRYYRELEKHSTEIYRVTPYSDDSKRVPFSFDWAFTYFPLSYERPGPEITIYRLRGGRCGDGTGPLSEIGSAKTRERAPDVLPEYAVSP